MLSSRLNIGLIRLLSDGGFFYLQLVIKFRKRVPAIQSTLAARMLLREIVGPVVTKYDEEVRPSFLHIKTSHVSSLGQKQVLSCHGEGIN